MWGVKRGREVERERERRERERERERALPRHCQGIVFIEINVLGCR